MHARGDREYMAHRACKERSELLLRACGDGGQVTDRPSKLVELSGRAHLVGARALGVGLGGA